MKLDFIPIIFNYKYTIAIQWINLSDFSIVHITHVVKLYKVLHLPHYPT